MGGGVSILLRPCNCCGRFRRKRVEDFLENLILFREGKWHLCVVVTGDESFFFIGKLVATMIMLHDNARRNQRFAVANLRQKSWFTFDLSEDAQSLFTF